LILQESSQINLPVVFISRREEDTFTQGMSLAPHLEKGSIVALKGPLGAGKTCFVKGIAMGLGISETITSPTYTIVSEYEGRIAGLGDPVLFYHIDAYRLDGEDAFRAIGGEEIIFGNGISVIEWSERIGSLISPGAITVSIEILADGSRQIRIYSGEGSK
jgi:tRNA threonylcarbamoyladenosine biosynthesis protein TsaE